MLCTEQTPSLRRQKRVVKADLILLALKRFVRLYFDWEENVGEKRLDDNAERNRERRLRGLNIVNGKTKNARLYESIGLEDLCRH